MPMKKIPGTFTIVCYIILAAALLTWIVPGGEYLREARMVNGVEREMVVDGSFHYVDKSPQTFSVFFALFQGFVENAGIIVFVLMVGGAFWVALFCYAGYFFGDLPFVQENLKVLVVAIIFISLLPAIIEVMRERAKLRKQQKS